VQLQKLMLRNQPTRSRRLREAENDIIARITERLESQADTLTPASAAVFARELMHL
jgi:hypothetical protein